MTVPISMGGRNSGASALYRGNWKQLSIQCSIWTGRGSRVSGLPLQGGQMPGCMHPGRYATVMLMMISLAVLPGIWTPACTHRGMHSHTVCRGYFRPISRSGKYLPPPKALMRGFLPPTAYMYTVWQTVRPGVTPGCGSSSCRSAAGLTARK